MIFIYSHVKMYFHPNEDKMLNLEKHTEHKIEVFQLTSKNPLETFQFLYTDKSYYIKIWYHVSFLK